MKYLRKYERRVHYALKCKRTFGYYIPMSGAIDAGNETLTRMLRDLINYRVDGRAIHSELNNMMTSVKSSRNRIKTLQIYGESHWPQDRRRYMTARRILKRLGYLEERHDHHETQIWATAKYRDAEEYIWITSKDIRWSSGMCLLAGSRVYYDGDGRFYTGSCRSVHLDLEEAIKAGVIKQ